VRRVPIPNRYTAKAKLCFCKNNKRRIISSEDNPVVASSIVRYVYLLKWLSVKSAKILEPRPRLVRDGQPGWGGSFANLGNAYMSQGDCAKAIEYHTKDLAIEKEVGDRGGGGIACGNLGISYQSQGGFSQAIAYLTQHLSIAKEVVDRTGEGWAHGDLGTCHMHLNEYVNTVAYFEAQHAWAISLKLTHVQSDVALKMGVAITLHVHVPGPYSHWSASACVDYRVREKA